jgi:hypothetical protein
MGCKVKKLGIENENEKKRNGGHWNKRNQSSIPGPLRGNTSAIRHSASWLSIGRSVGYCGYFWI